MQAIPKLIYRNGLPKAYTKYFNCSKVQRKTCFHEVCKNSACQSRYVITLPDQMQKGELWDRWRRKEVTELIVKRQVICVR